MTFGCQKSLIMKAPYFWWSQSSLLSSYTKMWNVCVVWPEPTWRWQYNRDFIVFSRHDDKYVHSCNCHRLQSAWKKKEFWKLWAPNSEASPVVTERCCRAPASCSSSSFPGQESTFCSMSQLWTLVSQGSVRHIQLHSGLSAAWLWSCFYCGLKWSQVHFWNVYLEEHILALQSPRMCKISFLLLYSLWHLFSFPCRVPGGRSATLPLALEIVVRAFIKVEGGGGNSRGLFIV